MGYSCKRMPSMAISGPCMQLRLLQSCASRLTFSYQRVMRQAWHSTEDEGLLDCLRSLVTQFSWKPIFSTVSVDGSSWWKTIAPLERSEEISPTLEFHGFTCVADLVDADFQVLVPIDASGDSISISDSISQELWERHLCQMCLVPMFGAESDLAGKWHIWISADGIAFAPGEYQASICLEGVNAWLRTQSLPEWSWRLFIGKIALNVDFIGPPFYLRTSPWFITLPVMLMKEL